ncbi:MAG: TRAP transporter substrate-binding protein DctP [Polyangiales bacterium]
MSRIRRVAGLALTLSLAAPGVSWGQRVLSMATLAPSGTLWMRALDAANRELRRRTGGALSFRWYAGGVQGDESEVVRKIRSRRLDGGALTATGLQQIYRPVLAFQLPAMFQSPEEFLRAYTALRPDLEAGFDRAGFTLVHLSPGLGPRMFSTREVRVPSDLRGCHPWQWHDDPILPALYAEAGARGVPLALPEVLSALQTRRVDTVYAPPLAAIALQWSTQVRYMSERSASGSLSALVLSRPAYESIPEAQREVLRAVLTQMTTVFRPAFIRGEQEAERSLVTRGITVVNLNEAERTQWRSLFARVRTRVASTIAEPGWIGRVESAARGAASR